MKGGEWGGGEGEGSRGRGERGLGGRGRGKGEGVIQDMKSTSGNLQQVVVVGHQV